MYAVWLLGNVNATGYNSKNVHGNHDSVRFFPCQSQDKSREKLHNGKNTSNCNAEPVTASPDGWVLTRYVIWLGVYLEGTHECLVHAHHGSSVIKLSTIVRSWEKSNQLSLGKELISILNNLYKEINMSMYDCLWNEILQICEYVLVSSWIARIMIPTCMPITQSDII